jgi:single-stranded DNA-specific DHH superfamily exonuclease
VIPAIQTAYRKNSPARIQQKNCEQRMAPNQTDVAAVSHRKDADGICAAALVRFMTQATVYLTDYADMPETLEQVRNYSEVFVSDLGLNPNTFEKFFDQLKRLRKEGAEVHYIDHHPIDDAYRLKLISAGIDVHHSVEECASVLIFQRYADKFEDSALMKILACCGAITDYMDSRPYAKSLIAAFDRQFLMYEATVLSFAIATIGRTGEDSNSRLIDVVRELASGKFPHEIDHASELAQSYAGRASQLITLLKREGKRMKNFAYFKTKESATGNVANFLVGAFGVPVGVAIREEQPGFYELSLRSIDESKHDLGKIVRKITETLDASGGGHPHASGARIRQSDLDSFLSMLDQQLDNKSAR